jgi:quercetin dioxygenase-like cupin family protein
MGSAPESLWFMGTFIRVRLSHRDGNDGISILEQTAPRGDSPPLHLHVEEDEAFHVLEGELRFSLDGEERAVGAGETAIAPKGVPHTYRVESDRGRWLVVTTHRQFEDFVRTMARPAETDDLPPPAGPPPPGAIDALVAKAKQFGIEILGPPLA